MRGELTQARPSRSQLLLPRLGPGSTQSVRQERRREQERVARFYDDQAAERLKREATIINEIVQMRVSFPCPTGPLALSDGAVWFGAVRCDPDFVRLGSPRRVEVGVPWVVHQKSNKLCLGARPVG
jgi:hypothetical protein